MSVVAVKGAIKTKLDGLNPSVLKAVISDDFDSNFQSREISDYPVAILSPAIIEADYYSNRENIRTYTFDILVVHRGDVQQSATLIETAIDSILNAFDNDPTLGGSANAGVEAASIPIPPFTSQDKSFVAYSVTIRARVLRDLSFS
jgi:hypothetical protein